MATAHEDVIFSPDSVDFRDHFQSLLSKRLRTIAVERARSQGRHEITLEDFQKSLQEAVAQAIHELHLPASS